MMCSANCKFVIEGGITGSRLADRRMLSAFCSTGRSARERREAQAERERIERRISLDAIRLRATVKILLLGASETGKSTVLKQMRVLHDNGFTKDELNLYKHLVLSQTASSVLHLCTQLEAAGGVLIHGATKAFLAALKEQHEMNKHTNTSYVLNQVGLMAIAEITKDENFKTFFAAYGNTYNEVNSYFVENCARIIDRAYRPTQADLIHVRVRTTGINEITFSVRPNNDVTTHFAVLDVAGVKSARKRWLETFDGVECIMFLIASSDFNLRMQEDPNKNRLADSLSLFKKIYRDPSFAKSHFALFLNKRDVLADKLKSLRLSDYFRNYTGDNSYEDVSKYIERLFGKCEVKERKIYVKHTCATDTDQMSVVIGQCFDEIRKQRMGATGID